MPYDAQVALKLLNEAGWTARDAQGRLVKDGRPLIVELLYSDKGSERWLTIYQDDLRKAGVTLNLRLVTPETRFQLQQQRKFDMVAANWAATTFPNPETEFHSKRADVPDTNNITGVKDTRLDELIARYDVEYDQRERAAIIREIDRILANLHHYVLEWDAPFQRIAYWNKFGHPEGYLSRIDDYYSASWLWWIDPERERQLNRAIADQTIKLEVGPLEIRYWQDYAKRAGEKGTGQTVGSVSK